MGRSKRVKSSGHWKPQSTNCYKGHEPNEDDSIFVIHNRRVYFDSQFAYCLRTHEICLVLGPEVTSDTLAIAE